MSNEILIIEDDEAIAELLEMNLTVAGYKTAVCMDGSDVSFFLKEHQNADLALLDIMLPGRDGFSLMEEFKRSNIPVIYLTAKADVMSKVKGLRLGAEDYMIKPFEILELLVRIEKVLERTNRLNRFLQIADVTVDLEKHQVQKGTMSINLKPLEYELLVLLVKNRNVALSREEILRRIWGTDFVGESRTVDVHIGQIRKKLGLGDVIKTVPKLGYRLESGE